MTISELLQSEHIRGLLADHYRRCVTAAVQGYADSATDDDTVTGALGRALRGQGELALPDGRIVRWATRHRKLRGRGRGAPEKHLGADGLFEIEMEDEDRDRSRKSLPFHARNGAAGYGDSLLRGQAKRLDNFPGGGVVVNYRPEGYVAVDARLVAEGEATRDSEVSLADALAEDFVGCRRGSTAYLFEPSVGGVLLVHRSFLTVRRWSPGHRIRTTLRLGSTAGRSTMG
jgi:hypothetical protein